MTYRLGQIFRAPHSIQEFTLVHCGPNEVALLNSQGDHFWSNPIEVKNTRKITKEDICKLGASGWSEIDQKDAKMQVIETSDMPNKTAPEMKSYYVLYMDKDEDEGISGKALFYRYDVGDLSELAFWISFHMVGKNMKKEPVDIFTQEQMDTAGNIADVVMEALEQCKNLPLKN